ncbi:hypothetical protein SEA_FRANCOB_243 [Streptomyces phage Francob]|uniref:Uncharacterized protein n=1 Tax=Streptomyces phage Gilson TaxID=2488789 RepID=A0A3T0ICW6_9CAUD|nr:membrane protein [Streptomyces phage Gilson]AZU97284.1 hypothetical protein SEA_GILSON_239 [Streptomyces phage Gilson]
MEWFHFSPFDVIGVGIMIYGFWKAFYRCPVGMNSSRILYWYCAWAWVFLGVVRIAEGRYANAVLDAGFAAYDFYRWWNSGGDEGVKNFLQSLVMKPAHAVR